MSFKTFLLVTQGETFDAGALDTAIGLATSRDAHLEVLCLGIDRMQVGYYFDGASAALIEQGIARARAAAKATEAQIARRLESESLSWGSRSAVAQVGAIPDIVGHAARFSDMVVIGKPYGKGKDPEEGAILEAALFEGRVPVLIVPGATAPDFARRIVLGWNQTAEALSAARAALPFLTAAEAVKVVMVAPGRHGRDESDPGGEISRWLSRHGARVEAAVLPRTLPRIADTISRYAMDEQANLIVMGAYSHSRFRESLLGGATRDMLADAVMPVLMAR
jgi:nucleotide-binding universal stress UspA family protein